jgi:hypothetical protein
MSFLRAALLGGVWLMILLGAGRGVAWSLEAQPGIPSHAYLYVEPYSARFECLVRLEEMLSMIGESTATMLPPEKQAIIQEKARKMAEDWLSLKLTPPSATPPVLKTVTVLKGVPGRTETLKPGDLIVVKDSLVGFIWEQDYETIPEDIEVTWKGFTTALPQLPLTIIVGNQSDESKLTETSPSMVWHNQGRVSLRSPLVEVPPVPPAAKIFVPLGTLLWVIFGVFYLIHQRKKTRRVPGRAFIAWTSLVLGAAVLWRVLAFEVTLPWSTNKPVAPDQAERILQSLLRNTYRAFDQRQESAIYDVLERSIHGPLLQKLYLQTLQSLKLDDQDAVRVQVNQVGVDVDGVRSLKVRPGFVVEGQWTALGTVGHWGHQHQRVNRYLATMTVEPIGEAWKLTDVVVKEEKRQ